MGMLSMSGPVGAERGNIRGRQKFQYSNVAYLETMCANGKRERTRAGRQETKGDTMGFIRQCID